MDTSSKFCKWISVFAMASMTFLAAPQVFAQNNSGGDGLAAGSTTTTLVGVTVVGGGIALTLILLTGGNNKSKSESKAEFLRQNATALQQDLTLGQGPAVQDLAAAFQVEREDRETFARMLHERRESLVPLTNVQKLNDKRAEKFFRKVAKGMQTHPALREDLSEISVSVDTEG